MVIRHSVIVDVVLSDRKPVGIAGQHDVTRPKMLMGVLDAAFDLFRIIRAGKMRDELRDGDRDRWHPGCILVREQWRQGGIHPAR
jgi:hypothetical protein